MTLPDIYMRISGSIVCYQNPPAQLAKVLACFAASRFPIAMTVIDNSRIKAIEEVAYEFSSRYIHCPDNPGFGAAHNIALKDSLVKGSDYHVVANPDVEFGPDTLETLVRFLESDSAVGAVAPKVLYPNGEVQHLCKLLPTPVDLIFRRFFPTVYAKAGWLKKYELRSCGYREVMSVPALSGSFMILRCSVLRQVGYFDERFFMYMEDVDLCRRIGQVSKTMFCPDATVVHEYGKGSYRNMKMLRYHIHSAVRYFNKWGWFFDDYRNRTNKAALDASSIY